MPEASWRAPAGFVTGFTCEKPQVSFDMSIFE